MYTVYRDPQGTRSLRSGKTVRNPRNLSVVSIAEDEFKTKIVTLNSEIKALNEEVELVWINCTMLCMYVYKIRKVRNCRNTGMCFVAKEADMPHLCCYMKSVITIFSHM